MLPKSSAGRPTVGKIVHGCLGRRYMCRFLQLPAQEVEGGAMGVEFQAAFKHGTHVLVVSQVFHGLELRECEGLKRYPDLFIGRHQFRYLSRNVEVKTMLLQARHDMGAQETV